MSNPVDTQSALRRAVAVIQRLERRVEAAESAGSEPIAIVGVGCRLPGGVQDLSMLWQLLSSGRDAVTAIPTSRFDVASVYDPDPTAPGKMYARDGAFLDSVDQFDADFFGISPRESAWIDPQHRLLVECAWEALEQAGMAGRARGTKVGVYVGIGASDYGHGLSLSSPEALDGYFATGTGVSFAAGRISYLLGLNGPAVAVDTACSSSLVAIHLACSALRAGECETALAGGVQVMLSPGPFILLSRLRALAPDGRCKSFSDRADGYGRGEGCGVLVLKRLSDAMHHGDCILAVLKGTAINHDGASSGLTTPNGLAQSAVVRHALKDARLEPADVDYVEAHGTGTSLGDPIEVEALAESYGRGRVQALRIGSLKTSIGHLEAAAGVAGVLKVVAALQHDALPPSLHAQVLSKHIDWESIPVRVVRQLEGWPRRSTPRRAGVSSFGISGTNAHVLLEEAPAVDAAASAPVRSSELIVLSAKTPRALNAAAARLREHLTAHPDLALGDIAYSLLTTRSLMAHRLALAVPNNAVLLDALAVAAVEGAPISGTRSSGAAPKVAFVFPGQGSQWFGMGRQLLVEEPVFRESIEACDRAIRAETGWSVIQELEAGETARLDRVDVVQPILFAFQIALAALWRSWGVIPDAVVGHSMGEVAAAVVANALSLEQGAAVTCLRSRLLRKISGQGAMALVELSIDETKAALLGFEDRVAVAVSNSTRSTVLSGEPGALAEVLAQLERRGVFSRLVKVDVASHSPQVDPLLDELVAVLAKVTPRVAELPIHSTVTGTVLTGGELSARYWADNLRQPVQFARVVQGLLSANITLFVEMSPHPLLVTAVEQLLQEAGAPGLATGSLRREQPERLTMLQALGALCCHGLSLDSAQLFPKGGRRVDLPRYSWQRQRHWTDPSLPSHGRSRATGHPLLGARIPAAGVAAVYELTLSLTELTWLADHCVGGHIVVPAAALAEMVRAATEDQEGISREVKGLLLQAPLLLSATEPVRVQVVFNSSISAAIHSQPAQAPVTAAWTLHATAEIGDAPITTPGPLRLDDIRRRCPEQLDIVRTYEVFRAVGIDYGPAFQGLRSLWCGQGEAFAEIALGPEVEGHRYGLHPALLDAALQTVAGALGAQLQRALVPFQLGRFVMYEARATSAFVHARLSEPPTAESATADVILTDASGRLIAEVGGLRLQVVDLEVFGRLTTRAAEQTLFRMGWPPAATPKAVTAITGTWVVVGLGNPDQEQALAENLRSCGADARMVPRADLRSIAAAEHVVCVWDAAGDASVAIDQASTGLVIVQALSGLEKPGRLWWVTRAAMAIAEGDDVKPPGSVLWGLGRTVMLEHPELRCTLLDIEPGGLAGDVITRELGAHDDESQVAWRRGQRHVARLMRAGLDNSKAEVPRSLRVDSSVLITGGLGALGLAAARSLALRGVKHLVLVGRRGADTPDASQFMVELAAFGTRVTVAAVDVTDRAALAQLLLSLPAQYPLRGVVHAAGVLDDGILAAQTPERFRGVMAAKVLGAWHLHQLTKHQDLDFFVLFSSLSGSLGSPGQGGYAAANTFLDALASSRRGIGLVGQSMAWGPWSERGLAAALSAELKQRLIRQGVGTISLQQGQALFETAMARAEPLLIIAPLDLNMAAKSLGAFVPPIWRDLLATSPMLHDTAGAGWASEVRGMPEGERLAAVKRLLQAEVARVLSLASPTLVHLDRPLKELGMDSLMGLELRSALARRTGLMLPLALVFERPTAESIASYVAAEMVKAKALPSQTVDASPLTSAGAAGQREATAALGQLLSAVKAPRVRLFCFHHAGGTADTFSPFASLAARGVEVHTLSTHRVSPSSQASARGYLDAASRYVRGLAGVPYVLLGHSLGALFAWRLAQELASSGAPRPLLLVVSAPPVDPTVRSEPLSGEVAFASDLEADTMLWACMPLGADEALDTPIAAFLGNDDPIVKEDALHSWKECTKRTFTVTVLPGSHFYLYQGASQQLFLEQLGARIQLELSSSDSGTGTP